MEMKTGKSWCVITGSPAVSERWGKAGGGVPSCQPCLLKMFWLVIHRLRRVVWEIFERSLGEEEGGQGWEEEMGSACA